MVIKRVGETTMNETVYVIGHKNPDSDSICSALAYANLKRLIGVNAIACRLGPLNEETKFILKYFDLENPLLLKDARSQLLDIDLDTAKTIHRSSAMKDAWSAMVDSTNRSLCVVDDNNRLVGVLSTSNLSAARLMNTEKLESLMKTASLEAIASTVGGTIEVRPRNFQSNGRVFIVTLSNSIEFDRQFKNSICILSDGVAKQKHLINHGIKCMIITCGQEISNEVRQLADIQGCAIIMTNNDTMSVARVINESFSVEHIMTSDPITYNSNEYVNEVAQKMANSRYRSYPVLDDDFNLVGAISRYHTLNYRRKHFILVDHSAKNQAIDYIDEAIIEEIIDHHHIGNIETDYPIYYRNQRCGCTCTIVALLYQENGLLPDRQMSGIMLSAIISDTLLFKSKTTTDLDRLTATWLAKIAEVDINAYASAMLGASVALKDAQPTEILNRDLKKYTFGQYNIAIGQTNYHKIEDVQLILPEFRTNLEKEQEEQQYDLMVMMFTNVMAEGSMFVYSGPLSYIMSNVISTQFDDNSGYDYEIISRKQQMIPKLSVILKSM